VAKERAMASAKPQQDVVEVRDGDEGHGREAEVIEISGDEYKHAVEQELASVGLTYSQLRTEAKKGVFSSLRARKLWLAIGEPRIAR
jgi:hypothetical protein